MYKLAIEHNTLHFSYAKDLAAYLLCFLLFSRETESKCKENYSDSCGGILKNMRRGVPDIFSFILFLFICIPINFHVLKFTAFGGKIITFYAW